MQPPGLGHGWQGRPLAADVAEHLEHHEAQEEEVEAGTDPRYDDERHLRQRLVKGKDWDSTGGIGVQYTKCNTNTSGSQPL